MNKIINNLSRAITVFCTLLLIQHTTRATPTQKSLFNQCKKAIPGIVNGSPKIVHIVNFIRLLEPRDPAITEEVLYQTVVKQVELINKYQLSGTFLLQYDALLDNRYQKLLQSLPKDRFEIGGWLEVPRPLAQNAGLTWRGNSAWDSRADVDFTTGYTPKEREKLIDTYMASFKKVFGYYPKTVGCWYLDSYSLNYMYQKYGIIASCNCKDQIGTDGYTLWGGYWNQAYYPSKLNAYMPAQTVKGQIPVPVFRMLGSDPIRQYDNGIGTGHQGVVTLEPVYKFGGGDSTWVNWFLKTLIDGEAMAFGYTQAGQENSFTWKAMQFGLSYQLKKIAALQKAGKLQVETMASTAKWYKKHFKVTPVTAVTAMEDLPGKNQKTLWMDSRFYRINLLWHGNQLRIRNIHLFDQSFVSPYFSQKAVGPKCALFTLPFVDGHFWSNKADTSRAGLVFWIKKQGVFEKMQGGRPVITRLDATKMQISWPLQNNAGILNIILGERNMNVQLLDAPENTIWKMSLLSFNNTELPFKQINTNSIQCQFKNHGYTINLLKGQFVDQSKIAPDHQIYSITPRKGTIEFDFGVR